MQVETFSWLASYPKSGNTWLRMLLSAYFQNGYVDINMDPFTTGDNLSVWLQNVSPIPLEALTHEQMFLLRGAALFNQLCSTNMKHNFIKTHHANKRFNQSAKLIPTELTCRAIYIVRDPRDVALSLARYVDTPVEEIVENFANEGYGLVADKSSPHFLGTWSEHVESWVNETWFPVHVVRYEDLMANTRLVCKEVLEFCKIEVDARRLERSVRACELSKLRKQEEQHGFREDRKPDAPRAFFGEGGSRWRDELSPELARKIEQDHGDVMRRYGYLDEAAKVVKMH